MKKFNIAFIFVFVLFALVQVNDPDPYLWIPIYLYPALVCFMNVKKKYDPLAHLGAIVFCLVYGIKLLMAKDGVVDWIEVHHAENIVQSMKATKPWIEQTREFGGLLIIIIVMISNMIMHKKAGVE